MVPGPVQGEEIMKLPPDLAAAARSQVGVAGRADNVNAVAAVGGTRERPSLEARARISRPCTSGPYPFPLEVGRVMIYIPSEGANKEVRG
jgi:hypothetical protein